MVVKFLFQSLALFFICENAFSQDGTLDPSFGNGGKVFTSFENLSAGVQELVVQPDGKIIAVGTVTHYASNTYQMALVRYNENGVIDETFGTQGKVVSAFSGLNVIMHSSELLSNGKILIGAQFIPIHFGPEDVIKSVLIRYNSDGSLDTDFGVNGIVSRDLFSAKAMARQADGKILIAGTVYENGLNYFCLIRYNADGTSDASFGNNGIVTTTMTELGTTIEMKIQTDTKIVVVSDYYHTSHSDFVVMRFNNDGSPDTNFGQMGMVAMGEAYDDWGATFFIQNDAKIVIAGISSSPPDFNQSYLVYRILPNGDFDLDFDNDGKMMYYLAPGIGPNKIVQLSDGKLIIVGYILNLMSYRDVILTRVLSDGTLDNTFGNNGSLVVINETSSGVGSIQQLLDFKVILGGTAGTLPNGSVTIPYKFMLLKFELDGELSNPFISGLQKAFKVFPNPVVSKLQLDFTLDKSEICSIDLYESNGRRIVTLLKDKAFPSGAVSETLYLPDLQKGIYFLALSTSSSKKIVKIIKS